MLKRLSHWSRQLKPGHFRLFLTLAELTEDNEHHAVTTAARELYELAESRHQCFRTRSGPKEERKPRHDPPRRKPAPEPGAPSLATNSSALATRGRGRHLLARLRVSLCWNTAIATGDDRSAAQRGQTRLLNQRPTKPDGQQQPRQDSQPLNSLRHSKPATPIRARCARGSRQRRGSRRRARGRDRGGTRRQRQGEAAEVSSSQA